MKKRFYLKQFFFCFYLKRKKNKSFCELCQMTSRELQKSIFLFRKREIQKMDLFATKNSGTVKMKKKNDILVFCGQR